MNRRSVDVFFRAVLVSLIMQYATSYVLQDENQLRMKKEHPLRYPFPRSIPKSLGEIPRRYSVPYPESREGFSNKQKRQGLITLPRIGRELELEEKLLYGLLPNMNKLISRVQEQFQNGKHSDEHRHNALPILLHNKNKIYLAAIGVVDTSNEVMNITEENGGVNVGRKGADMTEEEKSQGLIPLVRHGLGGYLAVIGELGPTGGMMPYPRLGRHTYEEAQTLIPYPRAGREIVEPFLGIYDIAVPEYVLDEPDGSLTALHFESIPVEKNKRKLAFIPRVGRKKRSITEDEIGNQEVPKIIDNEIIDEEPSKSIWEALKELDQDSFVRTYRQNARSRNGFVPRIGKKSSFMNLPYEMKRKMLFTPRIGRASLIPRIGRNDPRFQVKSRGASFIPRIGRSTSAIIPRIGRSENSHDKDTD